MIEVDLKLSGKVALVTGGSKGIGRDIAIALAREGASVVVTARGKDALDRIAQDFSELGIVGFVSDAVNQSSVTSVVQKLIDLHGGLDILVNNVGGAGQFGGFSELAEKDWRLAFDLNVMSMVNFVRSCEPYLRQSSAGRIVNISSLSGLQPGLFNPHYTITKAATINLSKFLSSYFANDHVLVNTVCPGPVFSDSWAANVARVALERKQSYVDAWAQVEAEEIRKIPLGRVGSGCDIASVVCFLASERASWITGSCFHVDGGKLRGIH